MHKTRINISLDHDLVNFIKIYVQENRTTISEVMAQFLLALKKQTEGENMEIIYSNPDFQNSIIEVLAKLHTGTAKWHSFEEVFGE